MVRGVGREDMKADSRFLVLQPAVTAPLTELGNERRGGNRFERGNDQFDWHGTLLVE